MSQAEHGDPGLPEERPGDPSVRDAGGNGVDTAPQDPDPPDPEGENGDAESEAPDTAPSTRGLDSLVALHEDGRDRVEALVFSAEEALDENRLAELLGFSPEQVLECLARLNDDYAAQARSFQLRRLAGGWQLVSRPRYADDIRRLLKVSIRQRLSRAALETLAVIAYKQPLTKAEIESIRGVAADGVLKTLLDRHLVTISGRSKGVGKPLLYATTREFLEYFGLEDLDGMPRLKELKELMQGRDPGEEGLPVMPLGELLPGPAAEREEEDALPAGSAPDAPDDPDGPAAGAEAPADEDTGWDDDEDPRAPGSPWGMP